MFTVNKMTISLIIDISHKIMRQQEVLIDMYKLPGKKSLNFVVTFSLDAVVTIKNNVSLTTTKYLWYHA